MTTADRAGRNPLVALILGWIVPGGGHFYGGQRGKGVLFFVLITGTIVAGMAMGAWTVLLPGLERLWYMAQICGGGPAIFLTLVSEHVAGPKYTAVPWADRLHEVGTLYTAVAGFLNLLVMMDAYVRLAYPDRGDGEKESGSRTGGRTGEENA